MAWKTAKKKKTTLFRFEISRPYNGGWRKGLVKKEKK
jgi:hypothetical protein